MTYSILNSRAGWFVKEKGRVIAHGFLSREQAEDFAERPRCACGNRAEPEADECWNCQQDRSHRAFWGSAHP